jgi:WD40 repeat protein
MAPPMGGPANSQPLVKLGSQSPSLDPARRVKINVGGRVFETTLSTINGADKSSTLHQKVTNSITENSELFFDRDSESFSTLLSVLRTGKLDDQDRDSESFPIGKLIREASYYGIVDQLQEALAPGPLDGIDVEKVRPLIPNGADFPSAFTTGSDGSVWVGHGSKITVYDWALRKGKSTVTELNTVKIMNRISDDTVVIGAEDFPGLHIYNIMNSTHTKSLTWVDKEDPRIYNPGVRAIASNETQIFASFESGQKLDNTLLVVDKNTLEIDREIGRQNGGTGHSKAATKLQWLPEKNLLLVGAAHGGAFGYSGYIRLWDIRSDKIVWDWAEPHYRNPRVEQRDVFADMVANEELAGIFKVSINSGSIAMADMRQLDATDPWLTLTETNPELEDTQGGADNKLLTHNKQLYVSRGGNLEVWSEVPLADSFKDLSVKEFWETSFRRNFVDHRRFTGDPISNLAVGGNRMFVSRKGHQAVEVWETRRSG